MYLENYYTSLTYRTIINDNTNCSWYLSQSAIGHKCTYSLSRQQRDCVYRDVFINVL